MDLVAEYREQERWRRWDDAIAMLPLSPGQTVLDLGCGAGAVSRRLRARGVEVIGIDADDALLAAARADCPGVHFENGDARRIDRTVDGIWTSFVTAYLGDLASVVAHWRACLRPGGFLAMVEVDDLLGHAPLALPFDAPRFYDEARGRYDFEAGRKLARAARDAGLEITDEIELPDDELAFTGPASDAVLAAWRRRLARMGGLKTFLGDDFVRFEAAFLGALADSAHRTTTRVMLVIARRA